MLIRFLSGLFAYFLGALFADLLFHTLPGGDLLLRGNLAFAGAAVGVGTVSLLIRNTRLITRFHRVAVPVLFIVWAVAARQVQPLIRVLLVIIPALLWPGAGRLVDDRLLIDAEPDLKAVGRSALLIAATAAASVPAYFALTIYGPALGILDYTGSALAMSGMLASAVANLVLRDQPHLHPRIAVVLYTAFWSGMLLLGYAGGGPLWIAIPWLAGLSLMILVRLRYNEGW